jgi:uncharacterized protein YdeI (YjbR/CyaY-like superfamily)
MELKDGAKTFYAKSGKHWRKWLEKNHQSERSVWLIIYRKETKVPSVYYTEAVDEALCFGWIDSKGNKRDDKSYYQFFAKRNPKSSWSKINKAKVEKLMAENLMTPAGLEAIEIAKQNGCWNALDDVENFVIPADLKKAFDKSKKAFKYWSGFSSSSRKGILDWIRSARTEETRQKRISQTVELAKENIKANQYVKK